MAVFTRALHLSHLEPDLQLNSLDRNTHGLRAENDRQKVVKYIEKTVYKPRRKSVGLAGHKDHEILSMNNGVFWDVTPCGSCKNRRFGGT
jgi:hypothetical protein